MRLLISAYACEPGTGSEGGHGWNYPSALAKRGHQVYAIVPTRWRQGVEEELSRSPLDDLRFIFVAERTWPMRLGWTLGSALRYFLWQWDASQAALRAEAVHHFDLVHHVSYGSLLGASFMWRLGKPFVFGPTGGGQTAPAAFLSYFGSFRRSEVLRTLVTKCAWPLDWPAIKTARAATILASNRETAALARRMGARHVDQSMLDVYLPDEYLVRPQAERPPRQSVRLLWVGRLLGRKGQQLTVEALNSVPPSVAVELEMIGDGPAEHEFRRWLASVDLVHPVTLRGRIPWDEVHRAYDAANIFIFTSLRDTVGIQLLEAMAHGLPVITLDHQGAAELVSADNGIKVPVSTPAETCRGIATAIATLAASRDLRAAMRVAARRRAAEFALSKRIDELELLYTSLIPESEKSGPNAASTREYASINVAQTESETDDFVPERYRQFARHLPAGCRRVLDLGCNVGRGGRALKEVRPDVELVGLDVVGARLERLPPDVYSSSVEASATSIPFESASFDAVLAGEFIEHLTESDANLMLSEVHRILGERGRFLLTTPNPQGINFRLKRMSVIGGAHLSQYTPRQLRTALQQQGFDHVRLLGSGRMTRHLGDRARPLWLYGSCLAIASMPERD